MKKTTKILLVLAAVVAMTIGAVSTVMAADYPAIAAWDGNEKEGWTATDADGKDITSTWAVADSGRWYYFDKTGTMVTDEFIETDEKWFYVGEDGALASGWMSFNDKDEDSAILEVIDEVNGKDLLDKNENNPYGKEIWVYLDPSEGALTDDWYQAEDGLWYYFEDIVMVAGDYAYEVDDEIYGFGKDGHMYVGWTEIFYTAADTKYDPLSDGKNKAIGWTYYDSHGVMNDAGWEKLDGEWYYFINTAGSRFVSTTGADANVILTSTYVEKAANADFDAAFYFNDKGQLAKGTTYIGKAAKGIEAFKVANDPAKGDYTAKPTKEFKLTLYFNTSTGAQETGEKDGKFFFTTSKHNVYYIDGSEYTSKDTEINYTKVGAEADLNGAMVKDAVVYNNDKKYYMYFDGDGNKVTNDLVALKGLSIGVVDGKILTTNGDTTRVDGKKYNFSNANGTLFTPNGATAFGASTKSTGAYVLEVKVPEGDKLAAAIAKEIDGKYVVGETVSYTVLLRENVKFTGLTATGDIIEDYTFKYYEGKDVLQSDKIGYKFTFVVNEIDDEADDNVVTLNIKTTPVNTVKYNDTVIGDFAAGETVTITAASGKAFAAANAVTGADGIAYVEKDDVLNINKVEFTMPSADVTLKGTEIAAYTIDMSACKNVAPLEKNMFFAGETITLLPAEDYLAVEVEEITYDNANETYITDAEFTMPASNIKVVAEGTKTVEKYDVNIATGSAITLGKLTVAGKEAELTEIEAGEEVVIAFTATVAKDEELAVTVKVGTLGVKEYKVSALDKDGKGTITITMPSGDVDVTIDVVEAEEE